ncbi:TonB-dependent receptor plug domain-containing protein [Noviherbaspirillum galbum]|uniref:TonB-dependent receptor n=1 Tax=Noviherbaspirillum galbum TaxID=2709383 RepID=A0A6B3SIH4_9BURK|nr:TonB-dependent receptor [Noviherbaspirillum galbum]NEX60654.1 TonB-dependent receptor [Noviherbaspirillum galbum]
MLATGMGAASAGDERREGAGSLAELPIEQLLTLDVYSASRFAQKLSEAPSAVSVVTAEDIKAFGWRTLADILASMRGLYINNDRNYTYLGARGFQRPGDYNSRFLLLIDGNRSNEAIYDQASIGTEALLDVDLIERVEFVAGPGSSVYGANAFFGVINVVTRSARAMPGAQAVVALGSNGSRTARASYGWRDENGAELLISATDFRTNGEDLRFAEFASAGNPGGLVRGLDADRYQSVLLKTSAGPFSLRLAHVERTKSVPTASFVQDFNDPRSRTVDAQTLVDAGYRHAVSGDTDVSVRLFGGAYDYNGDYVYDGSVQRDGSRARWQGAEARIMTTRFDRHKLVAGVEWQDDVRRRQFNYDASASHLDIDNPGSRKGIYLQDEVTLREDLLLNAGVRHDRLSATGGTTNPRLGLIWKASPATTLKALYGTAYRAPNAYELYYQILLEGGQKANPALRPERVRSWEFVAERHLATDTRLTASVFRNQVSNLISQVQDPADGLLVFRNLDSVTAQGVELEVERASQQGDRLRASFSLQQVRDEATGAAPTNAPRRLAKLNWTRPLFGDAWRAGVEARYAGPRRTLGGELGGAWQANLTLAAMKLMRGLELTASAYNLFDRRIAEPAGPEFVQDALPQPGRQLRLKLVYAF